MKNLTILILGNKDFTETFNELNLFIGSKIINIDSFDFNFIDSIKNPKIIVFFLNQSSEKLLKNDDVPILLVVNPLKKIKQNINFFTNQINEPFKAINFKNKIIATLAKNQFKMSSIIKLGNYVINKNDRKIRKNNLELKLTEKEVDFLILFTTSKSPINKNFILKNLWKYSSESDTHTIETHIHRLRKKILEKFDDNNFIKINKEGYYV